MAITGEKSTGSRPIGASAVDHHGGALFAMGILAALLRRERTGKGCRVDASLMQAALDLQAESLTAWLNKAEKPADVYVRRHVAGWYYAAPYGGYATANGHLAVSLCPLGVLGQATGEPQLASFSEQDSWRRQDETGELVAAALKAQPTERWRPAPGRAKLWTAPGQGEAR